MKKFYAILCLTIASLTQLQAQAPQGFNYQATVRNSSGDLVVNTNVYFKFNIIQGSQTAVPIFTETHYVPTDDLGQVNLVIGEGTANTGTFSELDWSLGSYYLGIELDTGSGYVAMGTTQLLSVPYALYAENSGNATSATPNLEAVLAENNSANNQQIKDLQDPTEAQDAVTLAYVLQLESQIEEINLNIDHDGDGFASLLDIYEDINEDGIINENDLPLHIREKEQRTFRSITINNQELEFSTGFTDLHTESYEKIMKGEGFGILDAQKSIHIVHDIRNSSISTKGDKHPLCVK